MYDPSVRDSFTSLSKWRRRLSEQVPRTIQGEEEAEVEAAAVLSAPEPRIAAVSCLYCMRFASALQRLPVCSDCCIAPFWMQAW